MENIPLVYVHWGNSDYLEYSLNQARHFNPLTPIYLFGDPTNSHYKNVTHKNISDFSQEADHFVKSYIHLNSIPEYYTIYWFKRWFIIKEYFFSIKYTGPIMCLDSDTLMYFKVSEEFAKFSKYKIVINSERSPHCLFFQSTNVLSDFCDFISKNYSSPEGIAALKESYRQYMKTGAPGGIDDMTFLYMYSNIEPATTGNSAVLINGEIYDNRMNFEDKYEFDSKKGIKKIYWKAGLPYVKDNESGEFYKMKLLHFQGPSKRYMHNYYCGKDLYMKRIWSPFHYFIQDAKSSIYRYLKST